MIIMNKVFLHKVFYSSQNYYKCFFSVILKINSSSKAKMYKFPYLWWLESVEIIICPLSFHMNTQILIINLKLDIYIDSARKLALDSSA